MEERSSFSSRVVLAAKGTNSLRVTIPQVVASTLGLRPGDELLWVIDPSSGMVRVGRAEETVGASSTAGEMGQPSAIHPGRERSAAPGSTDGSTGLPDGTVGEGEQAG